MVVGAFLGAQPEGVQADVRQIVYRQDTVSVWLTHEEQRESSAGPAQGNLPRVLVRVAREDLPAIEDLGPGGLTFVFLDARGQALAQGPVGTPDAPEREAGPEGSVPTVKLPRAQSIEVPAAPGEAAHDEEEAAVQGLEAAIAPEAQPAEAEEGAGQAAAQPEEALAEEARAAEDVAQATPEPSQPFLKLLGWILLGAGIALLAALGVYAWRRQR